ncbi:hypothetical protein CHCC20488_0696 [Bacillus paralicheniformis]|uniref:Uncharacterized protein n=1 Tax=Bacillus paralicheniformis TaxID=1648923 RepID=A0ABY3FY87_9BACI|nr:hypothetical protein CHCC5023_0809 [Bacillus paralicheniformis]TWJ78064.1 hypothetical protein CHCC5019_1185 [Bacillus paralicheniformis]TWJ80168.1 hypothetical protein CHCC20497_1651 [Bacillus paralicheniformis]TWL41733.1 hypothetical protein CHCC15381_3902 [Bacillus paralicheniformis]TWM33056.1 hypothetical protein CHCC14821_3652 [Bacillus paralicheniformis]
MLRRLFGLFRHMQHIQLTPSRCFHHEPLILKQLIIVFPKN